MLHILLGIAAVVVLCSVLRDKIKNSDKKTVQDKIDKVESDFEVHNLEKKLQKKETKLEKAKTKTNREENENE